MSDLVDVIGLYLRLDSGELAVLILSLPRIYAFMSVSQCLGLQAVPRLVRNAIVLSLAAFAVPINLGHLAKFDGSVASYSLFIAKEYAVGFMLGYVLGCVYWAVQSAGALIDNQRGAAIASSVDPIHGHETTLFGTLFTQAFLVYAFVSGAALHIILLVYHSFLIWPVGRMLPIPADHFPSMILAFADNSMRMIFIVAGPIVAIMFLAEFALALISRFAPQLQVFVLAMPIKSILAIFVLIFYLSRILPFAVDQLAGMEPQFGWLYDALEHASGPSRETPG